MDSWPKSLLFRTHHLWNSMTELILIPISWRAMIKKNICLYQIPFILVYKWVNGCTSKKQNLLSSVPPSKIFFEIVYVWKFKFDFIIWLRTIVPLSVRDGHWSVKFFGTTQFKTESILESITSFMLKCVVESINNSWMKRYKSDPSLNTQSCIKRLLVVRDSAF